MRIPPTEKNGRVQTSFVTVAVLDDDNKNDFKLDKNDIIEQFTCSRGKGGQNVNRIQSCVVLTHIPTGMMVRCEETRNQGKNREIAYQRLYEKLKTIEDRKNYDDYKSTRNQQIGNGSRGGQKRRTYRIKDDIVTDHVTGKECRWKDILKGKLELLSE